LYDSLLIFLQNIVLNIFNIVAIALCDTPFDQDILGIFPAFYSHGQRSKHNVLENYFKKVAIEGVIHGVLVFYWCCYIISRTLSKDGLSYGFEHLEFMIYFAVFNIFNLKIMFSVLYKSKNPLIILTTILNYGLFVAYIFLNKKRSDHFYLFDF
jgi:hypothetical protein